uniref:Uncharacterized protein n=1 Tax=Chenopodium quinoa TaxID=63459 RepID=A0A803MTL6_CHEQI
MTMLKKSNIAVLMALLMIIWMGESTAFRCGYCGKTPEFYGKSHCQSQCQHEDVPQIQAQPSSRIRAIRTRKIPI